MNKSFKTLFTIFLGILFIIPTFTANSSAVETSQDKLIELNDIYENGGISEEEYKAAKKILTSKKEDKLDKKKEIINKKNFNLIKSKKTFQLFSLIKKKDKEEEEISLEDLDELGVYQPIKEYPESMIKFFKKKGCKNFFCYKTKAGKYLYSNFTRSKIWAQRKPGNMMKAMAMYEIFYLGKLESSKFNFERYRKYYPNEYGFKQREDEKAIRSLIGINKGRVKMREALGMDMEVSIEDAIKRFWLLGEFLSLGEAKKLDKLNPEIKERHVLIEEYKLSIKSLQTKLETDNEKLAKKDKKK